MAMRASALACWASSWRSGAAVVRRRSLLLVNRRRPVRARCPRRWRTPAPCHDVKGDGGLCVNTEPQEALPIDGLPPRIGGAPPIISGLPPWLLDPATPGVAGPGQNPLLTPFPGATMPSPPPTSAPAPGPGLMPHVDISGPSAGDLQTAGSATAVVGGGGLLMLIIGAMALP